MKTLHGMKVTTGTLDGSTRPVLTEDGRRIGSIVCDAGPATTGPGEIVSTEDCDLVRFEDGSCYRLLW